MKGQMFLLASVIIVLGLISVSNLLGVYKTVEETRLQESLVLDRQLQNIKAEYEAAAAAAKLTGNATSSAIKYLANFSELLRNTGDVEVFYAFAFYNGTTGLYSLTVGNFLRDSINLTLNASNSQPAGFNVDVVDDRKNETRTFGTPEILGTAEVNITYVIRNENVTEVLPVTVSGRNYIALFYDIKVREGSDFIRVKEVYNITWPATVGGGG